MAVSSARHFPRSCNHDAQNFRLGRTKRHSLFHHYQLLQECSIRSKERNAFRKAWCLASEQLQEVTLPNYGCASKPMVRTALICKVLMPVRTWALHMKICKILMPVRTWALHMKICKILMPVRTWALHMKGIALHSK